jgi:hypothetical protein
MRINGSGQPFSREDNLRRQKRQKTERKQALVIFTHVNSYNHSAELAVVHYCGWWCKDGTYHSAELAVVHCCGWWCKDGTYHSADLAVVHYCGWWWCRYGTYEPTFPTVTPPLKNSHPIQGYSCSSTVSGSTFVGVMSYTRPCCREIIVAPPACSHPVQSCYAASQS